MAGVQDALASMGYTSLYMPTEEGKVWYDILPLERILGIAPIIPDYESKNACIPTSVRARKDVCFPVGMATTLKRDRVTISKLGSPLYYVNRLAWLYGR